MIIMPLFSGTSIKLSIVTAVPGINCILNQCFIHNYSGRDPGSNPRIKVEKFPCDDDRSSQSRSSESDEDSYMEEVSC